MNTKERKENQSSLQRNNHNLYTIMSTNPKSAFSISLFAAKKPPVEITEGRVLRSQMKQGR